MGRPQKPARCFKTAYDRKVGDRLAKYRTQYSAFLKGLEKVYEHYREEKGSAASGCFGFFTPTSSVIASIRKIKNTLTELYDKLHSREAWYAYANYTARAIIYESYLNKFQQIIIDGTVSVDVSGLLGNKDSKKTYLAFLDLYYNVDGYDIENALCYGYSVFKDAIKKGANQDREIALYKLENAIRYSVDLFGDYIVINPTPERRVRTKPGNYLAPTHYYRPPSEEDMENAQSAISQRGIVIEVRRHGYQSDGDEMVCQGMVVEDLPCRALDATL